MTDEIDFSSIDATPLKKEETTEKYFLDKKKLLGIKTTNEDYWHPTDIEDVLPEDFIYSVRNDFFQGDDYDWDITYQFSSAFRDPFTSEGQYGNTEMTFRRLYIILCERFLHSYFIDIYFSDVYPFSSARDYVEMLLWEAKDIYLHKVEDTVKYTRVTKAGKPDMRFKLNKELVSVGEESFQDVAEEAEEIVKTDIKCALANGTIPLYFDLKGSTLAKREEVGIFETNPFYATGRLIDDLRLFFRLEKKEWTTRTGIMV